jgi:hypothetical protein
MFTDWIHFLEWRTIRALLLPFSLLPFPGWRERRPEVLAQSVRGDIEPLNTGTVLIPESNGCFVETCRIDVCKTAKCQADRPSGELHRSDETFAGLGQRLVRSGRSVRDISAA